MLIKTRFTGRYQTMIVTLLRPSPQVPRPTAHSAIRCFDASLINIKSQNQQVLGAMIDLTWIFLLTVFQALNTILWSISYPEVRALHGKDELEDLIDMALDTIMHCRERWPGTAAASELYRKLATACLRSYNTNPSNPPSLLSANSPSSLTDANSPSASEHSSTTTGSAAHSYKSYQTPPPQFNYVFDGMPEPVHYDFNQMQQGPPPPPSFRSNSIFVNPSSMQNERRPSYYPPDFTQHSQNIAMNYSSLPPPQRVPVRTPTSMPQPSPSAIHNAQHQQQHTGMVENPYFANPAPFMFGNTSVFDEINYGTHMRQGSLSQEQQIELMQSLETDGLSEIDSFMNLNANAAVGIKLEGYSMGTTQ